MRRRDIGCRRYRRRRRSGIEGVVAKRIAEIGRDCSAGDPPKTLRATFDDDDTAERFEGEARRIAERRALGRNVVGAVAGISGPREGGEDAADIDVIDPVGSKSEK